MHLRELNRLLATGGNKASAARMPSYNVWVTCPWAELQNGTKDGFTYWTDLINTGAQANNIAATATTLRDGLRAFTGATAGSTITNPTDEPYGVLQINNTTDNETVCISGLDGANVAGNIVFSSGMRTWMEARIKTTVITDDLQGLFLGFGEEALCATVAIIGADDALTDKDLVGFHKNGDDAFTAAASIDVVHNTAGGGGVTKAISTIGSMVAATYVKLGIYCDGTRVYFFLNGTPSATSVLLTATNFPDGEEMAFYFALTNKGGGDAVAMIDWIKIAQERAA